MSASDTGVARWGFTPVPNPRGYPAVECDDCGATYQPRPNGFGVEGSVMRSHRRACPVRPVDVPIPGVCDA